MAGKSATILLGLAAVSRRGFNISYRIQIGSISDEERGWSSSLMSVIDRIPEDPCLGSD